VVTFSTRTAGGLPGDNLELLYNSVGSIILTDFVSLGVISSAAYPTDWQAFDFTYRRRERERSLCIPLHGH
jgi:hypothetical protein